MNERGRSRVVRFAETQRRIPGPTGEHAVSVLSRGTVDVALSSPPAPVSQAPHTQDEIYVVVRGRGVLMHGGRRDAVAEGDLLFVAAGIEHQFEEVRDGFTVWRIFYGRQGGEIT
ncbi:MAG: cupin domain-containing protein [Vicinamibacterales bacterium]